MRFEVIAKQLAKALTTEPLRPILRIRSSYNSDEFAIQGAEALIAIGPNSEKTIVAHVHRLLNEQDQLMLHESIMILGSQGPVAKIAVPALIRILQWYEPALMGEAATALGAIGPDALGLPSATWNAWRNTSSGEWRFGRAERCPRFTNR